VAENAAAKLSCFVPKGCGVHTESIHFLPCLPAVPKFTLLASRGERLPVHGDGSATRSHLYVSDVAEAFDIILHKASCWLTRFTTCVWPSAWLIVGWV